MGWEWVPLATAAVGSTATVVVASLGYRHGAQLARDRSEHERELAREARRYQRLAEAYVPVLRFASAVGQWSDLVHPIVWVGSTPPPLSFPTLEEQANVEALIAAYASPEVKDLMRVWHGELNEVRKADMIINFAQQSDARGSIDQAKVRMELEGTYRPGERAARQALGDQVSRELGHGPAEASIEPASKWRSFGRRTP